MKRNSGNSGDNQQGEVVAVDLGLKLQNQDRPFECHQNGRRSSGGDDDDNNNNGGDGGPTCNEYTTMSGTYNVVTTASVANHHLFKPLGGMATEEIGFPFTISQWKELERQAMIYKYMVSSLPVPHDLLYSSFSSSLSATSTFSPASYFLGRCGNGWNYRWVGNGNNKDAEPGRCRRTDGKKWRCSRDVAPNQKYCERHMHRGRPRSRKPVELVLHRQHSLSDFTVNKNINSSFAINTSSTKKTRLDGPDPRSVGSSFPCVSGSKGSTFDHPLVSGVSPFEDSRNLVSSEEQQWQQMVQTNMSTQLFQHQLEGESLNLNSHVGFNTKSDMTLLERPLIDAWPMVATGNKDNCGSNKVSFSSPNGGHGNAIDEDMCQIHMGLRVSDSWVDSSASLGGPLAEVLRPGSVAASTSRSASNLGSSDAGEGDFVTPPASTSRSASNLGSSDAGEGDFVTPPATAVSSPSGVLHKTLASHSDSSGSSSPTCPRSKAKSDMPFNWLN